MHTTSELMLFLGAVTAVPMHHLSCASSPEAVARVNEPQSDTFRTSLSLLYCASLRLMTICNAEAVETHSAHDNTSAVSIQSRRLRSLTWTRKSLVVPLHERPCYMRTHFIVSSYQESRTLESHMV
ncbi:hypothetical protein EV356DRAFT_500190 [Viridothelium virens]|uniref:Secreted protein n=1 Tax=Viridothelium virens TaxID=1048519 RepID=A0A6A6HCQ1_VIRVR|nr:hypothetical protein EV356DRAFT_500190 [Viridothelium virens]